MIMDVVIVEMMVIVAWDECDSNFDAQLVCEEDLNSNQINTILGCSNSNAENWYCDQEINECIAFRSKCYSSMQFY